MGFGSSLRSLTRFTLTLTLVFAFQNLQAAQKGDYPEGPDRELTPGSLCNQPDAYRYPENIAYCERDVLPETKNRIIATYNRVRGYRIEMKERSQYKIDHYIPLCAGGSNEENNLWPQYRKVYEVTDPLEALVCEKMKLGKLRQNRAVDLIREAKENLDKVPAILQEVRALQ